MTNARQSKLRLPAVDPSTVPAKVGSAYPQPFAAAVAAREKRALGDALGLRTFGVNLVRLAPGVLSSQRHWHSRQDEFVYVVEGELVLVTDAGEQTLSAGMAAGFPADSGDGHHLINRSDRDALYIEVGDRGAGDEVDYPDINMQRRNIDGEPRFVRRDGTPY